MKKILYPILFSIVVIVVAYGLFLSFKTNDKNNLANILTDTNDNSINNSVKQDEVMLGGSEDEATTTLDFGFSLYNDSLEDLVHDEWVESGTTYGRTQGTIWQDNQTDNGDGTYTYDWNAVDGYSDMTALMSNGDITPYVMLSTQITGAPTEETLANYFYNVFQSPLAFFDWIKSWFTDYKSYTNYYTFNNEPDYHFSKYRGLKYLGIWNAPARNFVNSFISTSKIIHQQSPNAKLCFNFTHADFTPNWDLNPYKGLDAMLELGAANYIDCLDLHFYGLHEKVDGTYIFRSRAEDFEWHTFANNIKSRMSNYGISDIEMIIGEYGVGTLAPDESRFEHSVREQSVEIVKQTVNYASEGFTKIFNILLVDLGTLDSCGDEPNQMAYWRCAGLITSNDLEEPYYLDKKSSFNVYKEMTSLLKGTWFNSTSTDTGILSYSFASSTADIYVGYANIDGDQTYSITLGQSYSSGKIIDAVGLYEQNIAVADLELGDVVATTTSTTTPKYIYLIK